MTDRLLRFAAPLVFFGATIYVYTVNSGSERRIVFPLLDRISADLNTQGQITLALLIGLGVFTSLLALRRSSYAEESD